MRYKNTKNYMVSMSTNHGFFIHFQIHADAWERFLTFLHKFNPAKYLP